MRQNSMTNISTMQIGCSIEFALKTTAAGLAIAIPTIIAYNYLVGKVQSFLIEIQIIGSEIVNLSICAKKQQYDLP